MADAGAGLDEAVAAAAADMRSPPVVLMHLLIRAGGDPRLGEALDRAAGQDPGAATSQRLARLSSLLRARPGAARIVAEVMAEADHAAAGETAVTVDCWARIFDRLASSHPAASVALYSLGDEDLLAQASDEIVSWLADLDLVGPDRTILDLGCGIGRLTHRLAPSSRITVGADVSGGMLLQAVERGGKAGRAAFVRTSGRDLAAFADCSFHLVLACDVFPYLVQAGPEAASVHLRELGRVLRPGGEAVVLNLSYRGDGERDRSDAASWAAGAGMLPAGEPERPFVLWDGMAWRWRKPG